MKKGIAGFLAVVTVLVFFPRSALATFSTPIALTPVGVATDPSIKVSSGGVVHAVWSENTFVGGIVNREIFYNRSTDGGATWPEANKRNISNSPYGSTNPEVVVDTNGDVHIVWEEYTVSGAQSGDAEIMYRTSGDGGVNYDTAINISNNSTHSISPNVEISGANRVYVVWADVSPNEGPYQVFLKRSTNGGTSFGNAVNISNTTHEVDRPQIVSRGGTVVVVWQSETEWGIYKVFSSDNGANFTSATNLSAGSGEYVQSPSLAFDGAGRLHVVAQEERFGNSSKTEIVYYRSTNAGQTFAAGVNITNTPDTGEGRPVVRSVGNDTVKVAYDGFVCSPDCEIAGVEKESINGGLSFSTPGPTDFITPTVAGIDFDAFGSILHLLYEELGTIWYRNGSRN